MTNLDHRITINRIQSSTSSVFNEPVDTFEPYITIWAERKDASAREAYRAQEVGAEITARFKVRYSDETATVTAKDTLTLEGGSTYNITGVRETERNKWLEIDCTVRADK